MKKLDPSLRWGDGIMAGVQVTDRPSFQRRLESSVEGCGQRPQPSLGWRGCGWGDGVVAGVTGLWLGWRGCGWGDEITAGVAGLWLGWRGCGWGAGDREAVIPAEAGI